MPIVDLDDVNVVAESRPENIKQRDYLTQEQLGTSTLYSKDVALDNIVQYISGVKWSVTYFQQLRNMNDELTQLDVNLPPTVQKYHRINNLDIMCQSSIEQTNIEEVEFEAVINAGFLPNKFDCIVTTLTGGREAIFNVDKIELKKYSLHDVYWVTFKLLAFITDETRNLYNNLIKKTVKEYVYDRNYVLDYSAPLILQSDYKRKLNYKNKFKEIVGYYLDNFLDNNINVITPPTNVSKYTDIYLTDFLFSIVETTDFPVFTKVNRIDLDSLEKKPYTIWDVVKDRELISLPRCEQNIGFKFSPYTYAEYVVRKMDVLGVGFVAGVLKPEEQAVIPDYKDISTYYKYFPKTYIEPRVMDTGTVLPMDTPTVLPDDRPVEDTDQNKPVTLPDDRPVEDVIPPDVDSEFNLMPDYQDPVLRPDDSYVLSSYFYKGDLKNMGILERNLFKYLKGDLSDTGELIQMTNQYHMWSTKDQYYLIPLLLVLIRDNIVNTYKSI